MAFETFYNKKRDRQADRLFFCILMDDYLLK